MASPSVFRVELEDGRIFDVEVEGSEPPTEDEIYAFLDTQETPKGKPGLTSPTLALRDKRVVRDMTDPSLMPQSTVEGDPDPHMYEDAGTYAAHAVGNIGPSAVNAAQGIGSFLFKGMQAMAGNTEAGMEAIDALRSVPSALAGRYGGVENIKRTLHDDPVGMAADVAPVVAGAPALASAARSGVRTAARFPGRVIDTSVAALSGRPFAAARGALGHGPVESVVGAVKKAISAAAPESAPASPVAPVASHPVTPAPSAAPSAPVSAAARPATRGPSPQMIQNELGIQARRQKVTLTEPQYKAATALVEQGKTPAESVAQVAKQVSEAPVKATPTAVAPEAQARATKATKRAKLTADEVDEYLRLTGRGMSHEDAVAALMQQRQLAKKLGTPDNETVRRRVATRNQTGRWPK